MFREGTWLLDTNYDGISDQSVDFGEKADQPLAGASDGDRVAELAEVRNNLEGDFELHIRFQRDANVRTE